MRTLLHIKVRSSELGYTCKVEPDKEQDASDSLQRQHVLKMLLLI